MNTILLCEGTTKSHGVNKPKQSAYLDSTYDSSGDIITISSDKKWATGLILSTEKLGLCKETSTEYIYSSHCSVNVFSYINEWTLMKGDLVTSEEEMFTKYGLKGLEMEVLTVNRINLSVTDKYLDPMGNQRYETPKNGKPINPDTAYIHFWVRVVDYQGDCKMAKAKI